MGQMKREPGGLTGAAMVSVATAKSGAPSSDVSESSESMVTTSDLQHSAIQSEFFTSTGTVPGGICRHFIIIT